MDHSIGALDPIARGSAHCLLRHVFDSVHPMDGEGGIKHYVLAWVLLAVITLGFIVNSIVMILE